MWSNPLSICSWFLETFNLILNLIFLSTWNLIFEGYTGSKNQVWNRQKIKFKNQFPDIQISKNQVQIDRRSVTEAEWSETYSNSIPKVQTGLSSFLLYHHSIAITTLLSNLIAVLDEFMWAPWFGSTIYIWNGQYQNRKHSMIFHLNNLMKIKTKQI